jgi:hypothetical protein
VVTEEGGKRDFSPMGFGPPPSLAKIGLLFESTFTIIYRVIVNIVSKVKVNKENSKVRNENLILSGVGQCGI